MNEKEKEHYRRYGLTSGNAEAYMVQVYLPAKTKDGEPVPNHAAKVSLIENYMVELTGGSTRVSNALGAWKDNNDETVYEDVQLIRTLIVGDLPKARVIAELLASRVKKTFDQDAVLYHITEIKHYAFV